MKLLGQDDGAYLPADLESGSLIQEVVGLVRDALMICEQDAPLLVQTMTSSARQAAMDGLPAMRAQCLSLVCAAMAWPDFRSTPSQPQEPVKDEEGKPAASPAPPSSGPGASSGYRYSCCSMRIL